MSPEVQPVPEGYATVAPWIVTRDTAKALLRLYMKGIDEVFEKALRSGATSVTELRNVPWGDRGGRVRDPLGNI
jgi:uncharacterized glyoxalase superfamily protein PhnB